RAQRPPFQRSDADIIDERVLLQPREGIAIGDPLRAWNRLRIDIESIEEQAAVRRIGAAIAGAVVEQRMQRIEADAVGAELMGKPDQAFEIGKIPHAPVAGRADAVELYRN